MSNRRPLPIEEYHVGVVCALPHEMTAVRAMLDEEDEQLKSKDAQDNNSYALGRMSQHNVVIACLPAGVCGPNAAATVAKDMLRTFTGLRFGLLVGIGGGIPNLPSGRDIRLGDIVVSQPDRGFGGVVQYDLGKNLGPDRFERKGDLNSPPTLLLAALASLQASSGLQACQVSKHLVEMNQKHPSLKDEGYTSPGINMDNLHCSRCDPSRWWWFLWLLLLWLCPLLRCKVCENGYCRRPSRRSENPVAHHGTIASGNQVVKDARVRDQLGREFNALCAETEAAGLMNNFPCIVLRGICDYADSHKNDAWQKYAAATAAAYAKELLQYVSAEKTSLEKPVQEILGILTEHVQDFREHYRRQEVHNQRQVNHYQSQERHYELQETQYQIERYCKCHRAFKTSSYEQHKTLIKGERVPGTCRWALDHPKYREWLRNPQNNLLWISADPGCGKSVLCKSLVDRDLRTTHIQPRPHIVCYFFFKDNEEQDNLAMALCALLHQLFAQQPRLIRHAVTTWEQNGEKMQQEVHQLWRILQSAVSDAEAEPTICVLDALDECREDDQCTLVKLLCDFHRRAFKVASESRLKFLVTSRPYESLQQWFEQIPLELPQVRLRGEDENDRIHEEINLVIDQRVNEFATKFILSSRHQESLRRRLLQMEHRTYLWLHLAMEEIRENYQNSLCPDEVQISSLPKTVDHAYERILQKINPRAKPNARMILLIIVGARRPLTIGEMSLALGAARAQKSDSLFQIPNKVRLERQIRQWCGLFIFINHSKIFLIHQTAKEFLLADESRINLRTSGWKWSFVTPQVENEMAGLCIQYLYLNQLDGKSDRNGRQCGDGVSDGLLEIQSPTQAEQSEFFEYCAEHWASHLDDHWVVGNENLLSKVLSLYDTKSDLWFTILWRATKPHEPQPQMNLIRLAAFLGHENILELILQRKQHCDINESDNEGCTALIWASLFGHEKVVQIILDRGADVNGPGGRYGPALYVASVGGHEKIVQMLLGNEADVNAYGGLYSSALQAAAIGGYEKIVEMLLNRGAHVNAQGGLYGTALHAALERGHGKIVQLLLDRGADVNSQAGKYGNALQSASERGHEKIVRMLLDNGADVNDHSGPYSSSLQAAAIGGYERIVEMLLDRGACINAQAEFSGSALQAASEGGHEKVVQLLLDRGADVNVQNGFSGNALQAASVRGHEKIVEVLLGRGAKVNAQGGKYGNALYAASFRGQEKTVQMLLDNGADVNAQGGLHGTALHVALERGNEKVVQMLLDNGADVNAQGGVYGNALQAASLHGHEKVVQILVELGADVNAQGGKYGNALYAALERGHEKVVQILLDRGAGINAQREHYGNALYSASFHGLAKVVQMLLDSGADVNAQGGEYGNALQAASVRGHEKIVQLLLHRKADVDAQGGDYGSALQVASASGHEKIVQMLLDNEADVNAHKGQYTNGNALQAASRFNHEMVVQVILNRGADVNAPGKNYGTALYEASVGGHEKVVQMLLERGAVINAQGGKYGNALQAASYYGREKVAQILLDQGADVDAHGGEYGNALQAASVGGHEKVVQILLGRRADVNAQGGFYGNALRAASERGHEKVVRILLDQGVDVNAHEGFYGNALQAASAGGHEKVVQILLDRGANVNASAVHLSELTHELTPPMQCLD